MEDAKTFLVTKQHPQAGPKTHSKTVMKLDHFLQKIDLLVIFLDRPSPYFPSL